MSTAQPDTNLPLPQFYARALRTLLPILDGDVSAVAPETQSSLQSAIDDLYVIGRMLSSLGVFSDNESVDELGERELVFMTAAWVLGEAETRGGLGGNDDRKAALERSDNAFSAFLNILDMYKVVPQGSEGVGAVPADPGRRREAKIAAHRRSKELRDKIAVSTSVNLRHPRLLDKLTPVQSGLPGQPASGSNPISFILALLSSSPDSSTSVNEEEADTRAPTLLLLRLLSDMAIASVGNNAMELAILAQAPSEPSEGPIEDPRQRRTGDDDATWRLDRAPGTYKPKELISGGGRVLRPFTILPSTAALSDKERLRSEVFRSGHRLPTMTIDEYLAEEDARGNIIRGGG